ncbi:MAG: hypothetical protein IAF58_12285 [Leptolyngbya sp.]|nr:hypothetical protein [Candidatus Melainabacteria bacterium]
MAQHYELANPGAQISVEENEQLSQIRYQAFGPKTDVYYQFHGASSSLDRFEHTNYNGKSHQFEINKYEPQVSAIAKNFSGWTLPPLTIDHSGRSTVLNPREIKPVPAPFEPPKMRLPDPALEEPSVVPPKVKTAEIEAPKVVALKEQPRANQSTFNTNQLAPTDGIYNPAGPPGLGESRPGESFGSEKEGGKGWDIDWRQSQQGFDGEGNTVYDYSGEIDDSSAIGIDGDTNFQTQETVSKSGHLLKRTLKYDGRLDYKVMTDIGPKELKGVTGITSTFNPAINSFDTEINCENGARYKSEVDHNGKVTKFLEIMTKVADRSAGVPTANVSNFANRGDNYHPARPIGIGGAIPGWAGGDNGPLDSRTAQVIKGDNGEVTYKYEGEIDDSSYVFNIGGDTNFKGQEILDSNNNLVSSSIEYDSSKDMTFLGVGGQPVEMEDVKTVKTVRGADGNFTSTVTSDDGTVRIFKFKGDGTIL